MDRIIEPKIVTTRIFTWKLRIEGKSRAERFKERSKHVSRGGRSAAIKLEKAEKQGRQRVLNPEVLSFQNGGPGQAPFPTERKLCKPIINWHFRAKRVGKERGLPFPCL